MSAEALAWAHPIGHQHAALFGDVASWNARDTHMFETLQALLDHLGPQARVVVWAHNSHLGDARATEPGDQGELNLGQLLKASARPGGLPGGLHHLHRHGHGRA